MATWLSTNKLEIHTGEFDTVSLISAAQWRGCNDSVFRIFMMVPAETAACHDIGAVFHLSPNGCFSSHHGATLSYGAREKAGIVEFWKKKRTQTAWTPWLKNSVSLFIVLRASR